MISYTPALGESICVMLAEGNSLRAICRMFGLAESTVRGWALDNAEFAAQTVRARELGCDALAEQCIEIADTPVEGEETTETTGGPNPGTSRKRGDMLGHRRLQIDTRLKLIGKWHQHRYGDKVQAEITGKDGGPVEMANVLTDAQLARIAGGAS